MRPARFTLAPLALAATLTVTLGALAPNVHAQNSVAGQAGIPVDIPSLPLGQALNELARQADLQMTFPAALVAGKTAPAVAGRLSVEQAAARLLAGSGLSAEVKGASVVVKQAPSTSPPSGDALPAIKVSAKAMLTDSPMAYLAKDAAAGALGDKSVLDTPFSITVVDSQEMAERGAKSIGQIFVNDAAVYTSTASSTTDWWGTQIRGMGVRNGYIDDIPMMLYWGGDFPTELVDSVTALKGLTGFMYGFGEPGGALSYQLKRPKTANEATVTVGYRNPSLLSAHVDINRDLGNELAVRVNVAREEGTAYNESEINRTVASLAADKNFGASVRWFNTVAYEKNSIKAEPIPFYFSQYDVTASGDRLPSVNDNYEDINVDNSSYKTEALLATTGVQWQINDRWNLKYQLGMSRRTHYSNKSFANLLNSEGDYQGVAYNFINQLDTLFTQAMLRGQMEIGGMKHEFVSGLGLQRSKDRNPVEYYWSHDFDGNIHQAQRFIFTRTPDFTLADLGQDARQVYAFASDTVHFNSHWQALFGLRYTDFRLADVDGNPSQDSRYSTQELSPTLALIYKPDARTSLYGSYIEALEPGTVVDGTFANKGDVLSATVSKQYEIGLKHDGTDIDYTAALFRVERVNRMSVQREALLPYLTQDGLSIYQGAELSGAYQFTRDLNLGLSAVYLDASIEKTEDISLQGHVPAFAPKWQVVGNVQYRVPGFTGLKLHGNVRYFGKSYASDANTLSVPDRTIVNAGFSHDFRMQSRDWTLFGNVYNVLNTKYWAGGGWSQGTVGEARNVSLALRTQF